MKTTLNFETLVLASGAGDSVHTSGSHFYCLAAGANSLVRFDDGAWISCPAGLKLDWPAGEKFANVYFKAASGASTIQFYSGEVEIGINLPI